MEMTIPKMKSILTMNLAEVLIIIDMLLLMTRSLVHLMKNNRHGVHCYSSNSLRNTDNKSMQH